MLLTLPSEEPIVQSLGTNSRSQIRDHKYKTRHYGDNVIRRRFEVPMSFRRAKSEDKEANANSNSHGNVNSVAVNTKDDRVCCGWRCDTPGAEYNQQREEPMHDQGS
jgi:hypothetical protein